MRNIDVTNYLADKKALVDAALRRSFGKNNPLFDIMYYSVDSGKRIRPILSIASYEANGGEDVESIMDVACGLELIHTYSLIHDDLPAMDDDDLRRGKPSLHKKYGEAVAILAGDGLFAYAFELMSRGEDRAHEKLAVVRAVSEAVGPAGVVYGQLLDIGRMERSPKTLRDIHLNKTARFIAVAVKAGAIMARAAQPKVERLYEAGLCLGMLFQYTDDILDIVGEKHALGKTPGKDEVSGKITAPAVYGLDGALFRARRYADLARQRFGALGADFDVFCQITDFVLRRTY
ncbi:polyprenyl synthetase family protein [candidate division WOR-3 bacterium]|nr:polyprenyl synthetase family protein [candidate division WOR-3 bacterium]